MEGAKPIFCTERTLRGSKAVKSGQGTVAAHLGAVRGAPEDLLF